MGKLFVATCLLLIAALAMFDKNGIDGVVPLIQANYNVNDAQTAIIRTTSSITHTVALFLLWIFGDAFNRRKLFLVSVALWIVLSLLSIVLGSQTFLIFVALRALASAASSIFTVLSSVVLADMFRDRALGVALMIMAGSGTLSAIVAAIINSWIVSNALPWQSLITTVPLLVVPPLLALLCNKTFRSLDGAKSSSNRQTICSSAVGFLSIKSYLLLTASSAFSVFHTTAYMFWGPSLYLAAVQSFPDGFYGLSYTMVTTANATNHMISLLAGLPTFLWLAQSWNHGTGLFAGRGGYNRAYPITSAAGSVLNSAAVFLSVLLLGKTYAGVQVSEFLFGIGNAAYFSLNHQFILMVVPSRSRSGAVALALLIQGLVSTPAAQLIGMISDAIRGDSTLAIDRFHAYQVALLCAGLFSIASTICNLALIIFFPADLKAAERADEEAAEASDEKTSLIGQPKPRSESVLETMIRSRTTTVNSSYLLGM